MKENNTLVGLHLYRKDGVYIVGKKKYTWHIPKALREFNVQPGDIVGVRKKMDQVLVIEVFREEIEETGREYKSIKGIIKRSEDLDEDLKLYLQD